MKDLFGTELTVDQVRDMESKGSRIKANGYASAPGSGPSGETCGTCENAVKNGRYWKCVLIVCTRGPGTDIRLKTPACRQWKKKTIL